MRAILTVGQRVQQRTWPAIRWLRPRRYRVARLPSVRAQVRQPTPAEVNQKSTRRDLDRSHPQEPGETHQCLAAVPGTFQGKQCSTHVQREGRERYAEKSGEPCGERSGPKQQQPRRQSPNVTPRASIEKDEKSVYRVVLAVFMSERSWMSRKSVPIKHLSHPSSVRRTSVSSHLDEWHGRPLTELCAAIAPRPPAATYAFHGRR
jgi:hypothetical protein